MKRLTFNTLAILAGDLGSRALGFVVTVYLARVLAASGFGMLNIGASVLGYLLLVVSPGVQFIETRNTAAGRERVSLVLSVRLPLSLAAIGISVPAIYLLVADPQLRITIILFLLSAIPLALYLDWYFSGKEDFAVNSRGKLLMAAAYLGSVVVMVKNPHDVPLAAIGFGVGNVAAVVYLLLIYKKRGGVLKLAADRSSAVALLRENVPVGFSQLLAQSAMNLPPILLGWLVSTAEAGVFSAALKVIFVLLVADRLLHTLLLPLATRYFVDRRDEAPALFSLMTRSVIMIFFPLTLAIMLGAPHVMQLLFGSVYEASIPLLQILVWYFLLTLVNTVCVVTLIASGNEREYTRAMVVGAAGAVAAIGIGTLLAGGTGAAAGVVFGELITLGLMAVRAAKVVSIRLFGDLLKPFVPALAMTAVAAMFWQWNFWGVMSFAIVIYLIAVIGVKPVSMKEMRYLVERFV